ncbi:MAG: hypothetical protein ABI382_07380 [Nakamurella sp.]
MADTENSTAAAGLRRYLPGVDAGRRISVLIGVVVLLAVIHVSYQYLVAPTYAYMLLTYTSPNLAVYTVMLALLVLIAAILPVRLVKPSDFLLWIVYLLVVIPSLTISLLAGTLTPWLQLMLGCVVTITFTGVILAGRLPTGWLTGRVKPLPPRVFWAIIVGLSLVTYGMLAASGHLKLALPGLADVYSVRGDFDQSVGGNKILAYLMPAQETVFNPLFMAVGLIRRKWWLAACGIVAELLLYGAGGHKSVLFSIPAVLVVAFLYRRGRVPTGALFTWGVGAVVGLSALIDSVLNTPWLTSLFTRRLIDVPGLLTGAWIKVFSDQPKAHYAYSFLAPFLPYHYDVAPPFVVASQYFNNPTLNANANLFANGYANFGWLGICLEAAMLALVIALANAAAHRAPLRAAVMLLAAPSVSLVNGSVFTSLLSHGVATVILVLAFAPKSIWGSAEPASSAPEVEAAPTASELPRRLTRHL